jgi:hypothetical protein
MKGGQEGEKKIYELPVGQRPLGRLPGSNCLFADPGLPESFNRTGLSGSSYLGSDIYAAFTAQLEQDASGATVGTLVPEQGQIRRDAKTTKEVSTILKTNPFPAYFGKGEEDPLEEPFAGYLQGPGPGNDDPSYRLVPDFTRVFDFKGLEKAAGGGPAGALPGPNLDDSWKPHSRGASYTAYTEPPGGPRDGMDWSLSHDTREPPRAGPWTPEPPEMPAEPVPQEPPSQEGSAQKGVEQKILPAGGNPQEDRDQLRARVAELQGRLEAVQKQKEQNTQEELLLFVGTGLMVLLTFHIASRC